MKVRLYAELAVAIALAAVLDLISKSLPLPRLPYGGSISLRALPILIIAMRHGTKAGMMAGGGYGVVDFLIHPVFVHPLQLLLDYPIALGALGSAGLVWGQRPTLSRGRLLVGILLASALRLAAHFVSGVVFFAQFAPAGQPLWLYSLLYNSSYIAPETIILILLTQLILRRMQTR
ncbi:MAG: energy-coupled thiamine transporter ThiT [Candidatus Latescibacteria bacterium]|nr:energy-coupled thiamine transporter ThiT [Candidatus Latescibacterota bacterium]